MRNCPMVIASLAVVLGSLSAQAATIYVSPAGNDAWSGLGADVPVATLERARDLLRQTKDPSSRVIVADGRYTLPQPFVLTPADSGVVYEAAPGARPVFSGGRVIRGFEPAGNGLWRAKIDDVADGSWYFDQLFVDGRRATRARSPNKFYYYMLDVQEETLVKGSGNRPQRARQTVTVRPADVSPLLELSDRELRDVQMVVYHKWDNTTRFIEGLDKSESAIVTTGEGLKPWNSWGKGDRYHLENFPAALDAPGLVRISAGNYNGRLGKSFIYLYPERQLAAT